jgi:GNAT superfamily N-acetyltransferase
LERDATVDSAGMPIRPRPDGSDVRKATTVDVSRVVDAVARSFYDDPVFTWGFPNDARRLSELQRSFALFARRVWCPQDEIYTTDRVIGGAFWMPPGTWHLSLLRQLVMLPTLAVITKRDFPRVIHTLNVIEAKHPHDLHFYLPVIGILPEWQGRGFGSALLRPMLERCDREQLPAYLEASSPRNRALYQRHGFNVVEEIRVAKDSPPMWRMWREPRSTSESHAAESAAPRRTG